jgi:hypothetical protein
MANALLVLNAGSSNEEAMIALDARRTLRGARA